MHTDTGREEFGRGTTAFWRRIVTSRTHFRQSCWQLFLRSGLTPLGGKVRADLRGDDMEEAHDRRGYATVATAVGGGKPRDGAVWGRRIRRSGACAIECRMLYETGNWLILTNCSNAFNTVERTAVLKGVENCMPASTPLVAKCYGTRPADVFSRMGLRGDQDDRLLQRCPARGPKGTGNILPGVAAWAEAILAGIREKGWKAFAYVDDVCLGLTGITANTVRALAFLRRELDDIGNVVDGAKTVALPPKGHVPTGGGDPAPCNR